MEDIGNFKEGFCFKLLASSELVWIVCADDLDDKNTWMAAIKSTKEAATTFEKPEK